MHLPAFLTPDDLFTLTGYKRPADQARWLEARGIPYFRNRLGRVVVQRDLSSVARMEEPQLGPVP